MKLFENFNKPIRLRKNILKKSLNKGKSIYDEMSHNVVYLFSVYDEMTQCRVFIFNPKFGQLPSGYDNFAFSS